MQMESTSQKNRQFSEKKLKELQGVLGEKINGFDNLTIYAVGSLGRLEANAKSDLDAFFVSTAPDEESEMEVKHPENSNLARVQLFSQIINIAKDANFPELSLDGQFLKILPLQKMQEKFGAPADDYDNMFTARMLLLLESKCLYGGEIYEKILDAVLETYFRDLEGHRENFQPTILTNDIVRYWKTLCLNFENRRNDSASGKSAPEKLYLDTKRVKLKYSRMITCFGTIIAISAPNFLINKENVKGICGKTPIERIETALMNGADNDMSAIIMDIKNLHDRFLTYCENPSPDQDAVNEMLAEADEFAKSIYRALKCVTKNDEDAMMRLLV